MLPKAHLDRLKLRRQAFGVERRRNMSKVVLENSVNFPLAVGYKDIDETFNKWVEETLDITYNGKRFPTFKLFSNQRINEYAQSWQHLDEVGNLLLNFKTVTRENNPKQGTSQGGMMNIPGNRNYPMFVVPTLDANGQEVYDMYSMKQPFSVDLIYTVGIVTNNYEVINIMNELVHDQFKSISCYIQPNGHFMSMNLEDISDESEYNIDDRKYYSQSYKIKIKAYIIKESDFIVTKLPSRLSVRVATMGEKREKPTVQIEETWANKCLEEAMKKASPYVNKGIHVIVDFKLCPEETQFIIDTDMVVEEVELENVYDFVILINQEVVQFDRDVNILDGDEITVKIEREDIEQEAKVIIKGYHPTEMIDSSIDMESQLDQPIDTEEIIHNA